MPKAKKVEQEEAKVAFEVHGVSRLPANMLQPSPYNPRRVKPYQVEALKKNIRANGFVVPLVVQKTSEQFGNNIIVGGHLRLRAAREICIEDNMPVPDLPAVLLDISDRKARKLNIALNKIGGEFDVKLLGEVLETIHSEEPITRDEANEIGLEEEDLSKYLKLSDPPVVEAEEEMQSFARSVTLSLQFTDTKVRDSVKKKLEERAKVESKQTGQIVFEMLGGK